MVPDVRTAAIQVLIHVSVRRSLSVRQNFVYTYSSLRYAGPLARLLFRLVELSDSYDHLRND